MESITNIMAVEQTIFAFRTNQSMATTNLAIRTRDVYVYVDVYGTEYEVNTVNPFKKNLHDHDAPCVVCYVSSRGSMLMMPARNDCPSGWREEYHGYLMTAYYNHKNQKDFICVDEDSEYVPGSGASRNGALLYVVEGACGSLPCLPYVEGRELTCAVCTK